MFSSVYPEVGYSSCAYHTIPECASNLVLVTPGRFKGYSRIKYFFRIDSLSTPKLSRYNLNNTTFKYSTQTGSSLSVVLESRVSLGYDRDPLLEILVCCYDLINFTRMYEYREDEFLKCAVLGIFHPTCSCTTGIAVLRRHSYVGINSINKYQRQNATKRTFALDNGDVGSTTMHVGLHLRRHNNQSTSIRPQHHQNHHIRTRASQRLHIFGRDG